MARWGAELIGRLIGKGVSTEEKTPAGNVLDAGLLSSPWKSINWGEGSNHFGKGEST